MSPRPVASIGCGEPYACLSYTWGAAATTEGPCSSSLLDNAPLTVIDAMTVTRELGIQYLWIDRYCIDQDDHEEKHETIHNMDAIYRNVSVTIIAAAGSDPQYGLPGVSRRRDTRPPFQIQNFKFTVMESPAEEVRASRWDTRGWTYQEMLLSLRRLVFTDSQVYFQCGRFQYFESLLEPRAGGSREDIRVFPHNGIGSDASHLYDRLDEYYKRNLSFNTNIINAFAGVFRAFTNIGIYFDGNMRCIPSGNNHFYGIPIFSTNSRYNVHDIWSSLFALNLAWTVRGSPWEHLPSSDHNTAPGNFPSWAWSFAKANRPIGDPGHIWLYYRDATVLDLFNGEIGVSFTHRSGLDMDIAMYVDHPDDYTRFQPWVKILSNTITGHIDEVGPGQFSFTALPLAEVMLHTSPRSARLSATAIYVGLLHKRFDPEELTNDKAHSRSMAFETHNDLVRASLEALFILVEESDRGEFFHIGICSKKVDEKTKNEWDHRRLHSGPDILSVLSDSTTWVHQELTIM